jgi:hypothetical protein
MSEISLSAVQSILGCEFSCRRWRGGKMVCEYYSDHQIKEIVQKQLDGGLKELTCEDSYPPYTVSRQEALDIIKQ